MNPVCSVWCILIILIPHHLYVKVVSTRILRDTNQQSRGVGFARMESRDKCEQIIRSIMMTMIIIMMKMMIKHINNDDTNMESRDKCEQIIRLLS